MDATTKKKATHLVYKIKPCPKPRMTQRDKWKQRPAVMRYRDFCDACRFLGVKVPASGARVVFHVPMPKSWSKTKRDRMAGQPHQQKPDLDNYAKALLDACYQDDCQVWDLHCQKIWTSGLGKIEIAISSAP